MNKNIVSHTLRSLSFECLLNRSSNTRNGVSQLGKALFITIASSKLEGLRINISLYTRTRTHAQSDLDTNIVF